MGGCLKQASKEPTEKTQDASPQRRTSLSQTTSPREKTKATNNVTKKEKTETKILLLGAGESGKSTVWKQMKILHAEGFTDEEREILYRPVIVENAVTLLQNLIQCAREAKLKISEENEEIAKEIEEYKIIVAADFEDNRAQLIKLWKDEAIQKIAQKKQNKISADLADSAPYWNEHYERVLAKDYAPTVKDIIKCRSKTTGISELRFEIDGENIKLIDVGGQRSERKKWISCFQNLHAIVFVVAVSEYDQTVREDGVTNRMQESLKLFKGVVANDALHHVSVILFLNKMDIFEEKLKKKSIDCCFDDYDGPQEVGAAIDFITTKFVELNTNTARTVHSHRTIATKSSQIREAMEFVKDTVVAGANVEAL